MWIFEKQKITDLSRKRPIEKKFFDMGASLTVQGVKLLFLSKRMVNTVFQCIKIFFVVTSKVSIFHQILPIYGINLGHHHRRKG